MPLAVEARGKICPLHNRSVTDWSWVEPIFSLDLRPPKGGKFTPGVENLNKMPVTRKVIGLDIKATTIDC